MHAMIPSLVSPPSERHTWNIPGLLRGEIDEMQWNPLSCFALPLHDLLLHMGNFDALAGRTGLGSVLAYY